MTSDGRVGMSGAIQDNSCAKNVGVAGCLCESTGSMCNKL
jgi:hypothetical protein